MLKLLDYKLHMTDSKNKQPDNLGDEEQRMDYLFFPEDESISGITDLITKKVARFSEEHLKSFRLYEESDEKTEFTPDIKTLITFDKITEGIFKPKEKKEKRKRIVKMVRQSWQRVTLKDKPDPSITLAVLKFLHDPRSLLIYRAIKNKEIMELLKKRREFK